MNGISSWKLGVNTSVMLFNISLNCEADRMSEWLDTTASSYRDSNICLASDVEYSCNNTKQNQHIYSIHRYWARANLSWFLNTLMFCHVVGMKVWMESHCVYRSQPFSILQLARSLILDAGWTHPKCQARQHLLLYVGRRQALLQCGPI